MTAWEYACRLGSKSYKVACEALLTKQVPGPGTWWDSLALFLEADGQLSGSANFRDMVGRLTRGNV